MRCAAEWFIFKEAQLMTFKFAQRLLKGSDSSLFCYGISTFLITLLYNIYGAIPT